MAALQAEGNILPKSSKLKWLPQYWDRAEDCVDI
jgi:hypothetical protein